jgi:hypothetical protein
MARPARRRMFRWTAPEVAAAVSGIASSPRHDGRRTATVQSHY